MIATSQTCRLFYDARQNKNQLGGIQLYIVRKFLSNSLTSIRGSGGALQAPPAGSGVEPQPTTILTHFRQKRMPLVLYIETIFVIICNYLVLDFYVNFTCNIIFGLSLFNSYKHFTDLMGTCTHSDLAPTNRFRQILATGGALVSTSLPDLHYPSRYYSDLQWLNYGVAGPAAAGGGQAEMSPKRPIFKSFRARCGKLGAHF